MKKPRFFGIKQLFGDNSGYNERDLTMMSEQIILDRVTALL